MDKYTALYNRTAQQIITAEELAEVIKELQESHDTGVKILLMKIINIKGDRSLRVFIEPFLHGTDSILAWEALLILCSHWRLTGKYLEVIDSFLEGMSWDEEHMCQSLAMSLAGRYLQGILYERELQPDIEISLLSKILRIAENTDNSMSDNAYITLYQILSDPTVGPDNVLDKAKALLERARQKR